MKLEIRIFSIIEKKINIDTSMTCLITWNKNERIEMYDFNSFFILTSTPFIPIASRSDFM